MMSPLLAIAALASRPHAARACDVSDPLPAGRHELTLQSGGTTRTYTVNVPDTYDPAVATPLLFTFHGYGNPPDQMCINTGTWRMSEAYGFVAVCPKGNGVDLGWNGGDCCGLAQILGTDDVGFARAMVTELKNRVCVDEDRVFANGYSNGGYLSYRLACEAGDVFKGIAPVAGRLSSPSRFTCDSPLPPVAHYHGTNDRTITFVPSYDAWRRYAEANDCVGEPIETFRNDTAKCVTYRACRGQANQATFCELEGMGHAWPGCEGDIGTGAGCGDGVSQDISASENSWKFLNEAVGMAPGATRFVAPAVGFNLTAGWARVLNETAALKASGGVQERDMLVYPRHGRDH